MPFYQKRGEIPPKRHIQFRKAGGGLHYEELVSRLGFSGVYSNLYHAKPPTALRKVGAFTPIPFEAWEHEHRHHHFRTAKLVSSGDAVSARVPMLANADVMLSKAHVEKSMDGLYRNGAHDEVIFVHSGRGKLRSNFGVLEAKPGDYLVVPRGVIWKMDVAEPMRLLVMETAGQVGTPEKYRNAHGQLLEHSPYCERDIRTPEFVPPDPKAGPVELKVRLEGGIQTYLYESHPFDLAGWDGFYFPWALSIHDFEPLTGRIHQPPPVHQTFQAPGLVICSFVPRLFDYHPLAIPVPYAHSNVDSDEVLYYAEGEFMSRKGIEKESITWHPAGLPHGPQPGKIEESLGAKETNELAVMVDTFRPLRAGAAMKAVDDPDYPLSWLEKK